MEYLICVGEVYDYNGSVKAYRLKDAEDDIIELSKKTLKKNIKSNKVKVLNLDIKGDGDISLKGAGVDKFIGGIQVNDDALRMYIEASGMK